MVSPRSDADMHVSVAQFGADFLIPPTLLALVCVGNLVKCSCSLQEAEC